MTRAYVRHALPLCSLAISLALIAPGSAQHKGGGTAPTGIVGLAIASPTVPPGGLLQVQVSLTEPKPILKGRQGILFASSAVRGAALETPLISAALVSPDAASGSTAGSTFGAVRDAELFSPDGSVSGVAVVGTSGMQVFFRSALTTFGTNTDTPVITMSVPVSTKAHRGDTVFLNFDPNAAQWMSPASTPYPVEFKPGKMTVGGTLSVTDVQPGEGVVRAGEIVVVKGIGFDPATKIQVDGATIASPEFVSSNEMRFTMAAAADLRGRRIRVTNQKNEIVSYFPSGRAASSGKSTHQLVVTSFPLYAQTRWSTAYVRPVQSGNVFTALALQNTQSSTANVTLRLRTKAGVLLASHTFALAAGTQIVRDLAEFFPGGLSLDGTSLQIKTDVALQMLAMRGDDSSGAMLPVDPLTAP